MNRFRILLFLLAAALASCKKGEDSINKFSDAAIQKIGDLQDRRNSDSLYYYFIHESSSIRKEAVLSFASIQDSMAIEKISTLLSDPDTAVRRAAAFALGQTRSSRSALVLENAAGSEKDVNVTNEIIEAYGKVTKKWASIGDSNIGALNEGRAWSMYRAGLNNAVDESANIIAAKYLDKKENERTRLAAAHFFGRSAKNINKFLPQLSNSALNDPSPEVRMAAAFAFRKLQSDSAFMTLESIIKNEQDHRVRVNAIRAMQSFPFGKTKDYLLRALNDKNLNVGIAASEVIKSTITDAFWIDLANRVTDLRNWRMQANLYEAILKVKENQAIVDEVKATYRKSTNPYQKASLLSALQPSLNSIDFIEQELFKADTPVIKTYAASAIVAMNRNKKFKASDKRRFADLYVRGIKTGEPGLISVFAEALGDSTLGYRGLVSDISSLKDAKGKLSLPKDNEVLQPLEQAIAYLEGRKLKTQVKNEFNHPIDWTLVKSIQRDQRAIIKTTKGNITIRLLVEEAPGSVANFVALAKQNYFDKKLFHRVVPNFVIQAGCNRGDGLGSEDYSIRSEFSQRRYTTGSVGMASAGKDTEGTQWFITHCSTPHLDGRYTIFAEVVNGIEAVNLIEVGDQITDVELVNPNPR